jgi:hypothetical protein
MKIGGFVDIYLKMSFLNSLIFLFNRGNPI